jgi:predicted thioesterase
VIQFRVWATDGSQEIGRGTHERAAIDLRKFMGRLR